MLSTTRICDSIKRSLAASRRSRRRGKRRPKATLQWQDAKRPGCVRRTVRRNVDRASLFSHAGLLRLRLLAPQAQELDAQVNRLKGDVKSAQKAQAAAEAEAGRQREQLAKLKKVADESEVSIVGLWSLASDVSPALRLHSRSRGPLLGPDARAGGAKVAVRRHGEGERPHHGQQQAVSGAARASTP